MADYSYIGVGKIYMKKVGAAAGLIEVGNCSALNFSITEDTRELRDYTAAGGGTYNEVRRVSAVEVAMTLHDLDSSNLARAVFGDANAIASGSVTDESHTAYVGAFIPTDYPRTGAIVVKESSTTLTAGTDYDATDGGIIVKSGGAISNGDTITFDYTKAAGNEVQAILNSAEEYELYFAGLNEARSGKAVTVQAYRVKIGAAQNLAFISEDYAALELTGRVLKDTSKNGTTVSQYFKVQIVS